jgi:hypothetical protein
MLGVSIECISEPVRERLVDESSGRAGQMSVSGEMTGGITHDIRNILAVIDSSLRSAERGGTVFYGSNAKAGRSQWPPFLGIAKALRASL